MILRPTNVVGEASLIQGYLAPLSGGYFGAFGLKDDAALVTPPPGHSLVITMDAIASGVHFFPDDEPADIGWKALAVNVSDLVAKGASPHAYLMSLAFPQPPTQAWMSGFVAGLAEAQAAFGLQLIGGDTDRRPGPVCITITAMGLVATGSMCQRTTARVGDIIFVSGTVGDSALGLKVRGHSTDAKSWGLDDVQRAHLVGRYLRPRPPIGIGAGLVRYASAAMDISDGLIKDLGRMVAASGVGATICVDKIPLSAAALVVMRLEPKARDIILAGGDDYEVLGTIAQTDWDAFVATVANAGVSVTRLGTIVSGGGVRVVDGEGGDILVNLDGYDHF
jgi:thiamine-monophosphate kinase